MQGRRERRSPCKRATGDAAERRLSTRCYQPMVSRRWEAFLASLRLSSAACSARTLATGVRFTSTITSPAATPAFWASCGFALAIDDPRFPVVRLEL